MKVFHKADGDFASGIHKEEIFQTKDFKIAYECLMAGEKQTKHVHRLVDEVFYVIEGEGLCFVNDKSITIKEGDLIWIEPNDIHSLMNPSELPLKLLIISGKSRINDIVTIE